MPSVAEKLTIDTPDQIALEYEIAGPGSRFMALFVDLLIQIIAMLVLFFALLVAGVSLSGLFTTANKWVLALLVLAGFSLQWGYFVSFEVLWKGQTPGKLQAGIRVINESGRQASLYEAVTRNLLRSIDSLPGPYAVGAIVMFISPQNKRLGDYVAGTIVVHDRSPEDDGLFFNTKDDAAQGIDCSAVDLNDLNVLETFLQRRIDLPLDLRQRTALKLADHFGQKCSVPRENRPDNENFLEAVVRGFRKSARLRK
jgi:uncharacterized RDD family membrane protein YckC